MFRFENKKKKLMYAIRKYVFSGISQILGKLMLNLTLISPMVLTKQASIVYMYVYNEMLL